jgi:hypothetical protein
MLATTTGGELEGEGGNSASSSEVQAAVAMGGAYDLQPKEDVGGEFVSAVTKFIGAPLEAHVAAVEAASPARRVTRRAAPLLLLHSTTDPVAPYGRAVDMEQAAVSRGSGQRWLLLRGPRISGVRDPLLAAARGTSAARGALQQRGGHRRCGTRDAR